MNSKFNAERRRALKVISGVSASGFIAGTPTMAAVLRNEHTPGAVLDCKLISRADILRAHLLIHNKTKTDIVVNTIESQTIRYDDSFLNLARAYPKSMTIPANDRVMVRLDMENTPEPMIIDNNVMAMDTQFLPLGSRVVDMKLIVRDGVAEVARYSVMT